MLILEASTTSDQRRDIQVDYLCKEYMGGKVTDLNEVSNDPQLQLYILAQLDDGKTVEIRPDKGPMYVFKQVDGFKLERKNPKSSSTDIIKTSLLFTHINCGAGKVIIRE